MWIRFSKDRVERTYLHLLLMTICLLSMSISVFQNQNVNSFKIVSLINVNWLNCFRLVPILKTKTILLLVVFCLQQGNFQQILIIVLVSPPPPVKKVKLPHKVPVVFPSIYYKEGILRKCQKLYVMYTNVVNALSDKGMVSHVSHDDSATE